MRISQGFWSDEMGDVEIIVHDGLIHAFHLCVPNHDIVAHLVSKDGLTWSQEKTALTTGDPGDFDDDQIWTMGIFKLNQKFFMLYTGLCCKERGKIQRVGLAFSDDLIHWRKHDGNPLIEADPRWYETTCDQTHRVDWRDPKVWVEDGVAHGVICARSNQGAINRRGCVGYFTSADGVNWDVKPPLATLGVCYELETPALFKIGSFYYLTGIHGQEHSESGPPPSIYRFAENVDGPYRRSADDELLPAGNFVFKFCQWNGETLLFHNLMGYGDWDGAEGRMIRCLAPPKVVESAENGELILRPFNDWDPVASGDWRPLALRANGLVPINKVESGFGMTLFPGEYDDFIFEAEVTLEDAKEFGVVFRSDGEGDEGAFVSFRPGRSSIRLYTLKRCLKNPSVGVMYGIRSRTTIQENHVKFVVGGTCRIRLVAYGPYVEFSAENRVLLSALSQSRPSGVLGFFTEDGRVRVGNARLRPLRPPA